MDGAPGGVSYKNGAYGMSNFTRFTHKGVRNDA